MRITVARGARMLTAAIEEKGVSQTDRDRVHEGEDGPNRKKSCFGKSKPGKSLKSLEKRRKSSAKNGLKIAKFSEISRKNHAFRA
jgi:hypothetical protein